MSFRSYLRDRKIGANAAGDFVSDAREDSQMPDVKSWPELRDYLEERGALPEAVKAARTVWQGYATKLHR